MSKTSVPSAAGILVPESLLKKQKAQEQLLKQKQADKKAQEKIRAEKRAVILKRAADQQRAYAASQREVIVKRRQAKVNGDIFVPAEPKLAFVIRIKGIKKVPPKPKKALQLLRLHQINNGVFVRLTKATEELLRIVEPYVTYGYPSRETVRKLIYKRGFGKVNSERVALSDNSTVEQSLSKYNIISIEDLINEIATVGPNFKQVNNFLWPFKLSNPSGGWSVPRKFKHFIEGGAVGNREEYINNLILKML